MALRNLRRRGILCLFLAGASSPAMGQTTQRPPDAQSAPASRPLDEIANEVVRLLRSGSYEELVPLWSDEAMSRIPPNRVGRLWETISSTLGPVVEVLPAETFVMEEGRRFSKVPIRFSSVVIGVTVSFDPATRVNGVAIQRTGG